MRALLRIGIYKAVFAGLLVAASAFLSAQGLPAGPERHSGPPPGSPDDRFQGRDFDKGGPGPESRMQGTPQGRWWNNPRVARDLALTADQQKRMDAVFVQSRMKLIDLTATLQKEELTLEPLLSVDRPEAARVFAQIDRVAQARAELEKVNGRMLFGLRDVLTADGKRLQAYVPSHAPSAGGPPH